MHVIGAPVLNTNSGFNLYLGNNPAATGMFVSISDTPRGSTWEELRRTGEVRASETLKQEAIAWARANPSDFLALSLKKAVYFWMPPFHKGEGEASAAERIVRVLWAIQFVFLVAAALGTLLNSKAKKQAIRAFLAGSWLLYSSAHAVLRDIPLPRTHHANHGDNGGARNRIAGFQQIIAAQRFAAADRRH